MWSRLCLCVCLWFHVSVYASVPQVVTAYQSDDDAPTPELAKRHGYNCETHEVQTEDGFLLHVHRLPGGRHQPVNKSLPPVLIQHGLLDSSADWLLAGPDSALGYLLADQGYDVWLSNARGNIYSKRHRSLKPEDPQFWNWTWHEMGHYDLPAVIDHILNVTGHSQIFYVGHSMGTTMFFVLCTTRPEYNAKVRFMAALAPVAYLGHTSSPIKYLAPYAQSFEKIANFFGRGQFLPRNTLINYIFKFSCELFKFEEEICENWLFLICGHDPAQFDEKLLPIILGHNPAGTSTKTLVHYAQEIRSDKFLRYDYGPEGNLLLYNSTEPPSYNLSLITVPLSLHYGDNDLLAGPVDVTRLFGQLHSAVALYRVNLSSFNHLDFLWARDVKPLVYNKVESWFQSYILPSHEKKGLVDLSDMDTWKIPSTIFKNRLNFGEDRRRWGHLTKTAHHWESSAAEKLKGIETFMTVMIENTFNFGKHDSITRVKIPSWRSSVSLEPVSYADQLSALDIP